MNTLFTTTLMALVYTASAAGLPEFKLKSEVGNLINFENGITISGVTTQTPGTKYLSGRIEFAKPVNLTKKSLAMKITGLKNPESVIAIFVRMYNAGSEQPVWSFVNWGKPFQNENSSTVTLAPFANSWNFKWEVQKIAAGQADKVNRIRFYIASLQPNRELSVAFTDFATADAPLNLHWTAKTEYAAIPADVKHPAGFFKSADVARGRANLARYPWARQRLAIYRERAKILMNLSPSELAARIPAEDSWFKCLCPNCFTQPEFAWRGGLLPDGKSIECAKCKHRFPSDKFPEKHHYTITLPNGIVKKIRYYHGPDQMIHDENIGPKYHISGAVNYARTRELWRVYPMSLVYALTGEKSYAEQTRRILLRIAEVYPGYVPKFRATAYETPRGHLMAGKLCAWKFHDSNVMQRWAQAYDLTLSSGLYSAADRLKIENGIFREYKNLITAFPADADHCLNAIPAHLSSAAMCAAMLGDHALMAWALESKGGLRDFIAKHYHRDGFWYENSASYAEMANDPLLQLADLLHGYSDPATYSGKDRYDKLNIFAMIPSLLQIFSSMGDAVLPTGKLPAINDSYAMQTLGLKYYDFICAHFPTAENQRKLIAAAGDPAQSGDDYSLFRRQSPPRMTSVTPPPADRVFAGVNWAMLRGGSNGALLLNFGGDAGGHTHLSTLDIIYCDFAQETVPDLGYLSWQHPNRPWLISQLAHNTVAIDRQNQQPGRTGELLGFDARHEIKSVAAKSPSCYPGLAERYERMLFYLPLPDGRRYVADFFAVKGGSRHLWSFHAAGEKLTLPQTITTAPASPEQLGKNGIHTSQLADLVSAQIPAGTHHFIWSGKTEKELNTVRFSALPRGATLFRATAPGLRNLADPFSPTPLNLLLLEAGGPENTFAGVIESYRDKPAIQAVRQLTLQPTANYASALEVKYANGTDLILFSAEPTHDFRVKEYPQLRFRGHGGAVRLRDNAARLLYLADGALLEYGDMKLTANAVTGGITAVDSARKVVTTDLAALPDTTANQYLLATAKKDGAYRLHRAFRENGKVMLEFSSDEVLRLSPGDRFEIPQYKELGK